LILCAIEDFELVGPIRDRLQSGEEYEDWPVRQALWGSRRRRLKRGVRLCSLKAFA
jgi:hypothetical protein